MEEPMISPAKVAELIASICDLARESGCNLGEIAQATRCVNATALAIVGDNAAELCERLAGE